jgi:hypothetical protein
MLNNLTSNFLLEMSKDESTPIQLLVFHFASGDVYLSDRDISIDGQTYEGLVEDWGELSTVGAENAVSSTMELDLSIWNGGNEPFSLKFLEEDPIDVFVDVYQTFEGLLEIDFAHIGEFVIQDPIENDEFSYLLRFTLVTSNMRYFSQVGNLLTKENYPYALEADLNKPIDLIVGDAGSVKCICCRKPAVATLSGSFLTKGKGVKILTHENPLEQGFPKWNGFIQIDDEIMSYWQVNRDGENDIILRDRGLDGTKAVDHSDGAEIVQAHINVEYIVGQSPLSSVSDIRAKGQLNSILTQIIEDEHGSTIIRMGKQPTYVEFSKGARSIVENFDAFNNDNDCYQPNYSFDPKNKALGSIISIDRGQTLSIIQLTPSDDDGEIVKLFLNVEHWATKAYIHDYVEVIVDGISTGNPNNRIGILDRPNADDIIDVGGEVDLDHGHDHDTGGDHGHYSTDPDFETDVDSHLHGINGLEDVTPAEASSYQGIRQISTSSIFKQNIYYQPNIANFTNARITFRITSYYVATSKVYDQAITIGGTKAYWYDRNVIMTGFITDPEKIVVTANGVGAVGDWIKYEILSLDLNSSPDATEAVNLDPTTTLSSSLSVDNNDAKVKDKEDVDRISEAERLKQLDIKLKDNSSRSVTQKFDITQYLDSIDWDWLNNKEVRVIYRKSLNPEDVEIVVTYISFEVEYRQRQIKTTDEITCKAIGSIENRPDAVIQYLLTEKAGLPSSKLGSVYRSVPKWDDVDIWNDSDVWIDEGSVDNVPTDALFEEAGAWFSAKGYLIDGKIPGNSSVKDAIENITFQTRSRLTWQSGFAKLSILRKGDNWLIAKDIGINDIQLKSFKSERSEASKIINKIDLFHSIDRLSEAEGSGQFSGTSFVKDLKSISKHGEKVQDDIWLFDLVRKQTMADSISDYYLWALGEPSTYYTLRTYLNNFDLEKEDYATITSSGFEFIKKLPITIKELVREFGSGKIDKMYTLKMVCQSIRHFFYIQRSNDNAYVNDSLTIDFWDMFPEDLASISDDLYITEGREIENEAIFSDLLEVLYLMGVQKENEVSFDSEITFDIEVNLEDSIQAIDDLNIAEELCFGSCGFGAPNCELPFGAKTTHKEAFNDIPSLSDILSCDIGIGEVDEADAGDYLGFSDGYGSPNTLGDGYGLSPYGDKL